MADLREIAVPAFPDAIAERKGHSTLQGKFAVQVRQSSGMLTHFSSMLRFI